MSTATNYNIRIQPRFLNRTEQNSFRTESEFFFSKKWNRKKYNLLCTPLVSSSFQKKYRWFLPCVWRHKGVGVRSRGFVRGGGLTYCRLTVRTCHPECIGGIFSVSGDDRKTSFLFQRISVLLCRFNLVTARFCFLTTARRFSLSSVLHFSSSFTRVGLNNNNNCYYYY